MFPAMERRLEFSSGDLYHNVFGWEAPYPFLSVPVPLGSVGGVGLLIGPLGLLWLKAVRDRDRAIRVRPAWTWLSCCC